MSFLSDAGRGLIRWTPKILEASADDIAKFGPQAARVRALLNFIPTMSEDAVKIANQAHMEAYDAARRAGTYKVYDHDEAYGAAMRAARSEEAGTAGWEAMMSVPIYPGWYPAKNSVMYPAMDAADVEVFSDVITPEQYRKVTNPMASARALDRLAGRAPESFIPIARDLGERGLVTEPSGIVSALRISKLPPHVQPLVTGLVDSGLTLEEAIAAARALS